ncbi:hypothetical protein HPO96_14980 [Kribbella sandramycini]|uniref:Uncharacterized protein n=1 Tax=Kribbella sandramycini TaxID=60450 RepID=A0A7Y4KZK3_9ACTN|nr:hypothetical protein [Kribbella sandramycini]MBB6565280.1 hypothetical protein [Kribbella sandramycini]NOL41549.1 hypothetical protein [Kribbella sandramycini]
MISEQQEVARYRVADQIRAAEARAAHQERPADGGARHGLAIALRRLADRLEPLAEPAGRARHARPQQPGRGLSVVR